MNDQLTVAEAAEAAGMTEATFRRQRDRGRIPEPDGVLGRTPWWHRATIVEWAATRPRRGRPHHIS